jgi:hypothetical protein
MTYPTTLDEDIDLALTDEPQRPATPGPVRTTRRDLAGRDLLHAVAYVAAVGIAGGAGVALAAVTR